MRRLTLAFGMLLAAGVAWAVPAETGEPGVTIQGSVIDADTRRPIGGAQVFVEGSVAGTLTGADGRYSIDVTDGDVQAGSVTVVVRLIGYVEQSRSVAIGNAATVTADFRLAPAPGGPVVDDVERAEQEADVPRPADASKLSQSPALREATMNQPVGILAGRAVGDHRYRRADINTESYAYLDENGWHTPADAPLSTFSIDVDRASYSNVRRFITQGRRPPIDAVRIEEMINYFTYDYPEARGDHPFTVSTEVGAAPWNPAHRLVRVGIQATRVDLEDLPPSNLVFLLDVSGSMQAPNKLPLLKRSLRLLVNELRPEDRVAVVVYAGAAGLVLESTPGSEKERILGAIEALEAGGSTAGGAGLKLAYDVAARSFVEGGNNRVILATDGDFNVGPSSDAEMTRLIEKRRDEGTFLTVLGFGMGNLKDSKMESIADHGNGNYAYIDSLLEARKVLVTEMGGTLLTIAKDVKIQVEFNPARVKAYRLIGYENRLLAAEDFNDDTKDAGELGAGHTVTALYEIVPPGVETPDRSSIDPLRYQEPESRPAAERGADSDELMFVKLRYKRPDGDRSRLIEQAVRDRVTDASADMRFAASVAAFGMLLRDSEHCGDFTLRDVARLAKGAVGEDRRGYRSEFVHLVEQTSGLGLLEAR